MKKRAAAITAIIIAVILVLLSVELASPVRAIKLAALAAGCGYKDVKCAEFRKTGEINAKTSVYKAVNTVLPDRLTASGHQTWYVHKILFFNIAVWGGNG